MDLRQVRLKEHATAVGVALSLDEVAFLGGASAGLTILATNKTGRYDVRASERVGVLTGPTLTAIIEPKVSIANLLMLLGYGTAFDLGSATQLGNDADLVEAMADAYAGALERALRTGGLVSSYHSSIEDVSIPRGRVDWLALETRRFGLFPPVPCHVSDLTVDTELNRRLLAAAVTMARLVSWRGSRGEKLQRLLANFVGVENRHHSDASLTPIHLDRRTERFRQALSLAEAILRGASFCLREGTVLAPGFLVDMNKVFEQFVIRLLDEEVQPFGHEVQDHPPGFYLDVQGRLDVKPDGLLVDGHGRRVVVVDAKYKSTAAGRVNDVYQMVAYCTALGLTRAALVYAEAKDTVHEIVNSPCVVSVFGVDLSRDAADLKRRLGEIGRALIGPQVALAS